ncbi:acyl-CoA carboxylase epsilon subunit [Streptomyces sp. NBC_01618]|uniref:acyl-CoA carboxylase epsilon subunit n=1 Tax=Streptomyces sp. NBC_01618 TaxID=2975900 RepID=UPI00386699E4|nr:acyl-CoA carboxylase subunit epsilon [Streptomyces sp. NBC_01618]
MTAAEPVPGPVIRVVRGAADAAELAAVAVVLLTVARSREHAAAHADDEEPAATPFRREGGHRPGGAWLSRDAPAWKPAV